MSAIYDTKEIEMKMQAPSSGCNTECTIKPNSEGFPTFSFVWCPYRTMVVCGCFNNTDLSNQGQIFFMYTFFVFLIILWAFFMVILLLFLLPSSFYQPLFSCFLHFFYCNFSFLISLSLSLSTLCFCAFILFCKLLCGFLGYCFNAYPFSMLSILSSSSKFSSFSNLLLISIAYSCFHFGF